MFLRRCITAPLSDAPPSWYSSYLHRHILCTSSRLDRCYRRAGGEHGVMRTRGWFLYMMWRIGNDISQNRKFLSGFKDETLRLLLPS